MRSIKEILGGLPIKRKSIQREQLYREYFGPTPKPTMVLDGGRPLRGSVWYVGDDGLQQRHIDLHNAMLMQGTMSQQRSDALSQLQEHDRLKHMQQMQNSAFTQQLHSGLMNAFHGKEKP